jgi:hypothetical protein
LLLLRPWKTSQEHKTLHLLKGLGVLLETSGKLPLGMRLEAQGMYVISAIVYEL